MHSFEDNDDEEEEEEDEDEDDFEYVSLCTPRPDNFNCHHRRAQWPVATKDCGNRAGAAAAAADRCGGQCAVNISSIRLAKVISKPQALASPIRGITFERSEAHNKWHKSQRMRSKKSHTNTK